MQVTPNTSAAGSPNKDFSQLVLRYISWWPVFVATVLICLTAAYLYLRYTVPVYESTATILIKDDDKGMNDSKILASLDLFSSKKIVENEIEVLHSRAVMKEVVKKLGLYAPVYQEGKINTISAYVWSPVKVEIRNPDSLVSHNRIDFEYDKQKQQVIIDRQAYPLDVWVNAPFGTARFINNNRYHEDNQHKKLFFALYDVRDVAKGLLNGLDVASTSKLATVINLRMKDEVPERGEDILNELIRVYNAFAIQDKSTLAGNALSFVQERLHLVMGELDSVETVLQHYKASRGVVDISEQGKLFLESVESNDQKISEMSVQLAVLDQVEKYVKTKDATPGMVPSTIGLSDANLTGLLGKLYDTEIQYEKLRKITAENSPIMISLQDQISRIKPSILENINNQRDNLQAGRANMTSTSSRYSSMLRSIPQKERELLEITRQQTIKNNIYTFLLQKKEEAALSFAGAIPDSRLIDSAESGATPVSPKKTLIYAVSVLLGLVLPASLISVKEFLNNGIRSRSEITEVSSFPVIGDISDAGVKTPIVISEGERTLVAEQFRQLRTALSYLGITGEKKKILVTSSIPGEGKSFIASNLAISLALAEKKVLLLELDLRKPSLGEVFSQSGQLGMSEYLQGKAGLEQIIKKTAVNNNLFLINAGAVPLNPSELILNGKLKELLSYADKHYDYIIIETAPISAVTDAYILSKYCDATLCVVRYGLTSKDDIKVIEENIQFKSLNNPAIVFNGVKILKLSKNSYGYNYAPPPAKTGKVTA